MLQRRITPAKKYMRRTLQIVALVGTLFIGIIALALIVSQTPWFRDWLRKYVVRQAGQYVNGTVSVGSLGGNLFYGVRLGDVAIDVDGERVLTLKSVEIKYSVAELVSQGVTVREIRLEEPYVLARRDARGWNLARLPRKQAQEADRQGPRRPVSLPSIEIVNGRAVVDDRAPSPSFRIPSRIDALNVKAGFEYAPVHYSVTLDHLSFSGKAPDLTLQKLAGRVGTRDDDLNVEKLFVQTGQSSLTVDGVVRNYLSAPSLQITASSPSLSLPEFGGVLPVVQGYDLHPSFDVRADGPQDALKLALNVKSEAGDVSGTVTADVKAPDLGVKGHVTTQHLDLAPLLKNPAQKSDITGRAEVDLRVASAPAQAPALDRLRGRVVFEGPRVVAAGYTASGVRVRADLAGRRIGLDGRANAYGGSATTRGFILLPPAAGQPLQFDLAGSASRINLAGLPRNLSAPRIATDLNATAYHVKGSAGRTTAIEGSATLAESSLAGGTIVSGTSAEFAMTSGPGKAGLQSLAYAARGEVRNVNLRRVGEAFEIAALAKPEYDSRLDTTFEVKGGGAGPGQARIDASGTATDSEVFGGSLPRMQYEAHVAGTRLSGRANGEFRGFDPGRIAANPRYHGNVSGTVDASFSVADTSAPITPDAVTADGRVTLAKSEVGGLQIDTADVQGQYANRRGTLRQASVKGPDIEVTASGPIALDQNGQSNLQYHVSAANLERLGALANQKGLAGSAVLDGTVTGNASSLTIAGTVNGSNVGYEDNKALDLNSRYTVTVPNLEFPRAKVQAETSGTFVQLGNVQINTLTATTTYADRTLDFTTHVAQGPSGGAAAAAAGGDASGTRELDASGKVIFHPDHQELHLPSLALRTQGVEWRTAPGAEATVKYGANRVEMLGVKLVNGDQSLDVDGSFSLGDNPEIGAIKVRAQNVDVAQIEKLALQNRGFTGRLNADATIAGSANAPSVTGRASILDGAFQRFTYQSLTVDGTFQNDRIGVDARLVQGPGVELTAKGTVPMSALRSQPSAPGAHVATAPGDQIDLQVQSSRIDLGLIQGFTNQLTGVTGTLQADVRVTGSGRDPHLNGYVDIQNGAFQVVQSGVGFSGLTTRVDLTGDRVRVANLRVLDENGHPLTISGELAVHERQPGAVNMSIDSDDFQVLDNELGELNVQTRLKLTGEVRKPRLEGEIRTDAARIELDRVLLLFSNAYSEEALPDVVSAQETVVSHKGADEATREAFARGRDIGAGAAPAQEASAPAVAPQTGIFSALELNLRVIAPDNFIVRGDDIRPGGANASQVGSVNATIGADLQVDKRENGPLLVRGTANTVRGFYEFQGRRFTIQRGGEVRFDGLPQINPDLNLTAERLIPNTGVTARINVTGTARAPQIALSSNPPLDEADILSLIVFNRSVNELGTGERASLAETAGGIASGFVASSLGKSIGRALDVDLFEITTSDPETGETAGGVTLGKQVGDRAFVRFRQQFGQRSFTEFMLEYQLARFLRAETRISPETSGVANRLTQRRVERAGIDLIFFFSY
ncbi:MAG TPA: translocation/assembly module TamB domain-containing protein [Vicinamibacterales bacterium]|nr:translocation/assembly module TamB domain-containing protein [Vicinamibacterales bacterium]